MPNYRGKFQYLLQSGSAAQQGLCQVQFDDERLILTPESGAPLAFDLGDVDAAVAADYEIRLPLYTGNTIRLQQFGKSYDDFARELLESYRKRTLQCLLLEDMQEVDRFTGAFTLEADGAPPVSGPAEMRLFKSNLAVLPTASQGFQWRLGDVDGLRFDSQNYEIAMEAAGDRLRVNRLAKRTELFHTKLRETIDQLNAESAQALHAILPFLNADQLQSTASILREGHSASAAKLAAIHARTPEALAANAVDKTLKPYYDDLLSRTARGLVFAGFKVIRPEDRELLAAVSEEARGETTDESGDSSSPKGMPDADEAAPEALYWFFFPIATKPGSVEPRNVVAWEASSRSGRATYFFRLLDPAEAGALRDSSRSAEAVERAVRRINRVLGMLNFRRRPIYLSDDDMSGNIAFHRYAVAAQRIADLRQVRAAFLGRAIHSSFDAWQGQVKSILEKAGL
jgi:hypothetical protein